VIQKSSLLRVVRESEAQLRVSREKFETLVNSIDGVVWESDPKTFRFTFVSQQGETLLGVSPEQWIAAEGFWTERICAADRERAINRRREALRDHIPFRMEYRMTGCEGKEVWVRES